jgi:hypothetical protein
MKALYTIAATLMLATPAVADKPVTAYEYCGMMSQLAEVIMEARQAGLPMRTTLEIIANTPSFPTEAMTIMAYQQPRWNSDSIKAEVIVDFGTEIYLLCLDGWA